MTDRIDITVPGVPVPFIRHETRVVPMWRGGKKVMTSMGYEPEYKPNCRPDNEMQKKWNRLWEWRFALRSAIRPAKPDEPWDGPVKLEAVIYVVRPQALYRNKDPRGCIPCDSRPDADNYGKVIMDVFSDCKVWADDGRVWSARFTKLYHAIGCGPGVRIRARLSNAVKVPLLWEQAA